MSSVKRKYLQDGVYHGFYVRAWREGRGRNSEIMVQVWLTQSSEGEPAGDWAMPGVLPLAAAMDQAILNTKP